MFDIKTVEDKNTPVLGFYKQGVVTLPLSDKSLKIGWKGWILWNLVGVITFEMDFDFGCDYFWNGLGVSVFFGICPRWLVHFGF